MKRINIRDNYLNTLAGKPSEWVPLQLDGFLYNEVGFALKKENNYKSTFEPNNDEDEGFIYNSLADIEKEPDLLKREISKRVIQYCPVLLTWPSYENRYFVTPSHYIRNEKKRIKRDVIQITSTIETPKGELTAVNLFNPYTVWTDKYPVETFEDIEKIRSIDWELPKDLEPPQEENLPRDFGERYILTTRISSPFVCVAGMMPYEQFLELCATHPKLLKELGVECQRRILSLLDVLLQKKNIDIVWMGGCEWITPPMGSPETYKELVQELEAPIIERIHKGKALSHVHCHGNIDSTLDLIIERGADFTEPVEPPPDGDISFAEAKKRASGRITLGGNVEARVLAKGTVKETEKAVNEAFDGGKERMVLMPTAYPIDIFTPRMQENYHCLIDMWEKMSVVEG